MQTDLNILSKPQILKNHGFPKKNNIETKSSFGKMCQLEKYFPCVLLPTNCIQIFLLSISCFLRIFL
jgi:hypothetical protein